MTAVSPLVLLEVPLRVIHALLAGKPTAACERMASRPPVAWSVGVPTGRPRHPPRLSEAAVASATLARRYGDADDAPRRAVSAREVTT